MPRADIDLKGARILVIDDEPANLDLLNRSLEGAGFEVLVATSGHDGLSLSARTQPDIILLDVRMPGMDGFETCLAASLPRTPPGTSPLSS